LALFFSLSFYQQIIFLNQTMNFATRTTTVLFKRNLLCLQNNQRFSSTTTAAAAAVAAAVVTSSPQETKQKQPFCLLDLRQSNLSVMERLCLEECLLRHDDRQWMIMGTHHPTQSRFLSTPELPLYLTTNINNNKDATRYDDDNDKNPSSTTPCIVVMGIGGKPELLLNMDRVKADKIWVIKRFSGGGTVVVDEHCLYTTIIGRNTHLKHVPPYPREIMDWTSADVFGPLFQQLKKRAQQQHPNGAFPDFSLRENDYVLDGTQKVAGNAQSIVKTGFLHHTTFLWTFQEDNMTYLSLPAKRPEYRKDRDHSNFLIQLKDAYHDQLKMDAFFESLETVCRSSFDVTDVSLDETLSIVDNVVGQGGLQAFFDTKSRTRLLDMPS